MQSNCTGSASRKEKTELNVMMGLCMGHDILFLKHSKAPTTTLVVKDRILCHNTVVAIYGSDGFYKRLYRKDQKNIALPMHDNEYKSIIALIIKKVSYTITCAFCTLNRIARILDCFLKGTPQKPSC